MVINQNKITKYEKGFGWAGFGNGEEIAKYYQYVLKKINSNIIIYIPYCDFDPLVGQLGKTKCAKSINYKNIQHYHNYIKYIKQTYGDNVHLGTSCLYNGIKYYNNALIIPCYNKLFKGTLPFQGDILRKIPWNKKKTALVWRGGCSGECVISVRRRIVSSLWDKPGCNVKLSKDWCKLPQDHKYIGERISKEEQLQYKFILCIDGNGWPGNLEWVFFTGCVPVIICDWHIWFYKYLKPGYHFVEINTDLSNLLPVVDDLLNNPDKYYQISLNANRFAKEYLNSKAIKKYIYKSLLR
jgi:hypothetical protein